MKTGNKTLLAAALTVIAASPATAQQQDATDTLSLQHLQEIVVSGVRAKKDAPYAVTEIGEKALQSHARTGRELPLLLARTPGIMAWGENGLGTGTTYMRIRGAGASRINVTLDGVPLNSPEDQCVFWANMNSYAALLGSVQIQRGVGTSTNGDGAFGGVVALSTARPSLKPAGEVNFSYGSYNTMNYGASASTGLLWNQLTADFAWHQTETDGFLHGTDGRSGSYYAGISWMPTSSFSLRYKNIGNYEHTGQAWNGVTAGDNDLSLMDGTYGKNTGIKTYKDLYDRGLGKFNSLYERLAYDDEGHFARDANGNYLTERYRMNDGTPWPRTTDNFEQNHNILSAVWDLGRHWTTTATLHYTYGYGYYEEFRPENKLPKKFGLNYFKADGKEKKSDVVRKKGLTQHTYGLLWNANYKDDRWDITGGLALQRFTGNHFGRITYIADEAISAEVLSGGAYKYYDSDATKDDHSLFIKAAYSITPSLTAWGDVQYRHVGYRTDGYNDKFIKQPDGTYDKHYLDIDKHYHFANPKAGLSFHRGGHRAYVSHAIAHREPERNNFTDNGHYPAPKAESVFDTEAGYSFTAPTWHAGLGLYHMHYHNQFVQTGLENEIGEKLTTNIKRSYRLGIELTAGVDLTKWLSLEGNASLSRNRILDFDEEASVYWEDDWRTIHYDNSTLAFSPSVLLNGFVNFHWKGIEATWHTNFVSRQYLDNTENKDRSLPAYSTSNLSLSYTLPCKKWLDLKEIVIGTDLSNLFNARYAASGWVYSTICEEYGHPDENRYYQIGFVPAAGFTAMGSITLRF